MTDPCKNNAFAGSVADDRGGFSANQSKPWRHGEHSYIAVWKQWSVDRFEITAGLTGYMGSCRQGGENTSSSRKMMLKTIAVSLWLWRHSDVPQNVSPAVIQKRLIGPHDVSLTSGPSCCLQNDSTIFTATKNCLSLNAFYLQRCWNLFGHASHYTPRNEVRGGGILESPCPSVRL